MEAAAVARQTTCSAVGRAERSGRLAMLYKCRRQLDSKGVAAGIGDGGKGSSGGGRVETRAKHPLESLCWCMCIRGVAGGNQEQNQDIDEETRQRS